MNYIDGLILILSFSRNTEVEMRQSLCDAVPRKRRLVMRTPSRLYRITTPESKGANSWGVSGTPNILGPEFVVRSKDPSRVVSLLQDTQVWYWSPSVGCGDLIFICLFIFLKCETELMLDNILCFEVVDFSGCFCIICIYS